MYGPKCERMIPKDSWVPGNTLKQNQQN